MTRRGEIYYVDWSPARGSEQGGMRPALIIQNDVGNTHSRTTIVAAISRQRTRGYPFQVPISTRESGLSLDSVVKCQQILTIDQSRLGQLVGIVDTETMSEVDLALHRSLGLRH